MPWFSTTLQWYSVLFILGIITFPITSILFGRFKDYGYSFSKIIGILIISYTMFVLGISKIIPFYREALFILVILLACGSYYLLRKKPFKLSHKQIYLLIAEEILFFVALVFWVYVRGQEPSVRGLEKFMDYGFMNSILRSKYFPPADMWLSGHTINYYYFGHLLGAVMTKLSGIGSALSYNLILASIFALAVTQTFSLCFSLFFLALKRSKYALVGALLGVFLVNLSGNIHPLYAFTKGYPNEKPVAPWTLENPRVGCYVSDQTSATPKWQLFCPASYWYPNATRFIPLTIHEFPIYSYVVADLHGHVFGIPFVLLTLALLSIFFIKHANTTNQKDKNKTFKLKDIFSLITHYQLPITSLLGFIAAVNYMTNAFDGPIYMLLMVIMLLYFYKVTWNFLLHFVTLVSSFIIFSLPFSLFFKPFVSGIGVNCAPQSLVSMQKLGPFLFEKGNCQISQWWMLMILWGFFWFNFIWYIAFIRTENLKPSDEKRAIGNYFLLLFSFGTLLLIIPEFFYIKDIYPAHFRANTMFKLGYQAFIMMSIASAYAFVKIKWSSPNFRFRKVYLFSFGLLFFFTALYPYFAITSYYGKLSKIPQLDGSLWLQSSYPEYKEIIDYLNSSIKAQPTILEAQGDSYTDYDVVSSYTGLPTVAGWLVHQWLWRGDPKVVSDIAPDIQTIYETTDIAQTSNLLHKYNIKFVIIGTNEKEKYKNINEEKFYSLGNEVFTSSNSQGKIFAIN